MTNTWALAHFSCHSHQHIFRQIFCFGASIKSLSRVWLPNKPGTGAWFVICSIIPLLTLTKYTFLEMVKICNTFQNCRCEDMQLDKNYCLWIFSVSDLDSSLSKQSRLDLLWSVSCDLPIVFPIKIAGVLWKQLFWRGFFAIIQTDFSWFAFT